MPRAALCACPAALLRLGRVGLVFMSAATGLVSKFSVSVMLVLISFCIVVLMMWLLCFRICRARCGDELQRCCRRRVLGGAGLDFDAGFSLLVHVIPLPCMTAIKGRAECL